MFSTTVHQTAITSVLRTAPLPLNWQQLPHSQTNKLDPQRLTELEISRTTNRSFIIHVRWTRCGLKGSCLPFCSFYRNIVSLFDCVRDWFQCKRWSSSVRQKFKVAVKITKSEISLAVKAAPASVAVEMHMLLVSTLLLWRGRLLHLSCVRVCAWICEDFSTSCHIFC